MAKSKEQKAYEKLITDFGNSPKIETLEEYLNGNNRYVYYTPSVYIKIMKKLHLNDDNLGFIMLITDITRIDDWRVFHKKFNIMRMKDDVNSILHHSSIHENNREILVHLYNLDGNGFYNMKTLSDELLIAASAIRYRRDRVLRTLKHPAIVRMLYRRDTNLEFVDHRTASVAGHHFIGLVIKYDGKHNAVVRADRPLEELDEFIQSLGIDSDQNCSKIKSVESNISTALNMPDPVFAAMNLLPNNLLSQKLYSYTLVTFPSIVHEKNTNELLEEMREEFNDKETEEAIIFEKSCWKRITQISSSIYIGDDYAWIPEFNQFLEGYNIPIKFQTMACNIIRVILEDYLESFDISCEFMRSKLIPGYLTIQLKKVS